MVKQSKFRLLLITLSFGVLLLILLSNTDNMTKSIGTILAILLISSGIIVTSRYKKYFEKTTEGNMDYH